MNPAKTTVTLERMRQLELAAETEVAALEKMLSTKSASSLEFGHFVGPERFGTPTAF